MKSPKVTILFLALTLIFLASCGLTGNQLNAQTNESKPLGESIAFLRNGDVWLMNPDGSDQRPFVSGITNARGRLSWSPDSKRLAFARQGKVTINYPEGGGGYHSIYDLFFAYPDSIGVQDNFWMSFTTSLGAQSPDWAENNSLISYTLDLSGNVVDATSPDYTVGLFDPNAEKHYNLEMPKDSLNLMAIMPTISPDGKQVCFVLVDFKSASMNRLGLAVSGTDKMILTSTELLQMAEKFPEANSPAWSPDGKWIAFLQGDGLYIIKPDLSEAQLVIHPEEGLWVSGIPCWAPDSQKLAYGTSNGSIYVVNMNGTGNHKISGPGADMNPAWTK